MQVQSNPTMASFSHEEQTQNAQWETHFPTNGTGYWVDTETGEVHGTRPERKGLLRRISSSVLKALGFKK